VPYTYRYPHPAVTTDIVIFTIAEGELRVLLIQRSLPPFRNDWALPGGFVRIEESLEDCARRELAEETGVADLYLEQLYTFGEPDRDPRERVITVAYLALVPRDRLQPRAGSDAREVGWFGLKALPTLAFDHKDIVKMAHQRLKAKLDNSTIALQFLPATFTLSELQSVHETILREGIDKRNFRKRLLGLDLLRDTGKLRREGAHRPARLYRARNPKRIEFIR
jgi:ADP-ribose pyrophosphatase YjhB (NUDIX family)